MIALNLNIINTAKDLLNASDKQECDKLTQQIAEIAEEIAKLTAQRESLKARCKKLIIGPTTAVIKNSSIVGIGNDAANIDAIMKFNLWQKTL